MPEVSELNGGPSKAALVTQFWRERQTLIGFARKYVYDPDIGEEVFQEGCLRFLRSDTRFKDYLPAAAYLYKIMKSVIIDRHKKNRRLVFPGTLPEMVCEPEPEWHKQLLLEKIERASCLLSGYDRQLIGDCVSSDFSSLKSQSRAYGLPMSTYRYQTQKAFKRLRKLINSKRRLIQKCESRKGERFNETAASRSVRQH